MKYRIAIAGFLLFSLGFVLASRSYDFICGCASSKPMGNTLGSDLCYQCMLSPKYQNHMILFQIIMIVSIFVVLYGFFTEFEYGKK
jgi:carbon starvation protein CstA